MPSVQEWKAEIQAIAAEAQQVEAQIAAETTPPGDFSAGVGNWEGNQVQVAAIEYINSLPNPGGEIATPGAVVAAGQAQELAYYQNAAASAPHYAGGTPDAYRTLHVRVGGSEVATMRVPRTARRLVVNRR